MCYVSENTRGRWGNSVWNCSAGPKQRTLLPAPTQRQAGHTTGHLAHPSASNQTPRPIHGPTFMAKERKKGSKISQSVPNRNRASRYLAVRIGLLAESCCSCKGKRNTASSTCTSNHHYKRIYQIAEKSNTRH